MTANSWLPAAGQTPQTPRNVMVTHSFIKGSVDLRWDDPAQDPKNTSYTVLGCNIYRSFASQRGPYHRVNTYPIGGNFYRDRTDHARVTETVDWNTGWFRKGDNPNDMGWAIKTRYPIVKPAGPPGTPADSPADVTLKIDGTIVPVDRVFGPTGEVRLINWEVYDPATEALLPPVLPTQGSSVTLTYYRPANVVPTGPDAKVWYRVSTVAVDTNTGSNLTETPLDFCEPRSHMEVENLDYIWREAIRRNNWILEQGGERVKLFVRRLAGQICSCKLDPELREYTAQPSQRCLSCWGTGWVCGYEGPYEIIIGPDDAERRISQTPSGRRMEHSYEVWMGPTPAVSQRDFIVKQTNERFSIGPVRRPTNRGAFMQQHFNIAYLDDNDIRYQVPVSGTADMTWPQTRLSKDPNSPYPVGADPVANPQGTEKNNIPDEREHRGRTPVYENINY